MKHIGATIEIKDSDTSMQVSETIENIVDIYNGNEEIHLIEEEENRNMFADVVRRFGELFDCPTKTFTSLTLILSL